MKRYTMTAEKTELGELTSLHVEYTESPDGEWVKWEDVKESHLSTAKRIYLLEYALRQLAETAELCDGWESFPSEALEKAYKALDTFF